MSNPGLSAILLLLGSLTLTPAEAAQVTAAVDAAQGATADESTPPAIAESPVAVPDAKTDEVTAAAPATQSPIPKAVLEVPLDLATIPAHRIISGDEVRFQKTYNGVTFDVPPAGATGHFYLITVGL